jgi:hypothetical protein
VLSLKANELVEFRGQSTGGCGTDRIEKFDCDFRTVFCISDPFLTNVGHEDRRDQTVVYHIREDPPQLEDDWVRARPGENSQPEWQNTKYDMNESIEMTIMRGAQQSAANDWPIRITQC